MATLFAELKKALTTTTDGAALLPYDLDSMLHEELLKLSPLSALVQTIQAEAKTHEYNVRSSHPYGWFEGETTPANAGNSVYARKTVALKIMRAWGSVTGFAQAMDERFVDALSRELIGSLEGLANVTEYSAMFGAADDIGFTGDAYQYSGILPRLFAYAPANIIDAGGDKATLDDLDAALAKATAFRGIAGDPKLWLMGLRMKQIVDGLQTKVQLPLTTAQLNDGKIVMATYGRTPIYETDYVVPGTSSPNAPTDTAAAGGSMVDGDYTYRISSVTLFGECIGGTASAGVTTATTNNSVDLSWTADADAKLYFIWRKKSTETPYSLIDVINAKTYDAAGTVNGNRTTYTDTGAKAKIAVKPLETGDQQIFLANLNPQRGVAFMGKIDDMGRPVDRFMSFVELARVKDSYDYMLKAYQALRLVHPNVNAVIRHIRLS